MLNLNKVGFAEKVNKCTYKVNNQLYMLISLA